MIESLETAVRLEPSIQSFNLLADAYERSNREEEAASLRDKLKKVVAKHNTPQRVTQQRKVVM